MTGTSTDETALMANAIRALAMDAVQQANSGHPGAPMGMAEIAVALWDRHLKYNPAQSALGRPRPLRAVQRPCVDAAVRAAASHRLRFADERAAQLPPTAQPHAGPPRSGPDARRRDHHRPAGPGHRQCRRHGAGRKAAGAGVQPPWPRRGRPPHLCLPRRRLHDGRHQPRSQRAGRCMEAEQAGGAVRRQRHQHRRRRQTLVHRRRQAALPGLRLERHRADRRQRCRQRRRRAR